ncbi:family 4 glycosyl hydrolase [Pseudonocardia sp. TRM90224]|uniref:family 4 glycosyl hydrolase n=1 Tax=Pseudonocardia sp. TRM90224 TaxID=2812678 RepID=UPI001E65AC9F|nr:6-phospho-beta-glucosidase [Pseudonocardia sp. TRM90224]
MKVAVVGGGSTYTPELVDGFARLAGQLGIEEIALVDPAAERLSLIGPLTERIFARHGYPVKVSWTADVEEGASDASIVVIQLRVGGQEARISDETIPLPCGCIGQETTGAGGLAKALRTVPVVRELARVAAKVAAPNAWIVDFTNPVGIVTRALLDDGHRAVGLCNVAIHLARRFAAMLDVEPERVELDHVGLNHLTWERAVVVDGVDRLPELLDSRLAEIAGEVNLPPAVLAMSGTVPSYYLRYFYSHDLVLEEQLAGDIRGQKVADIETELLKLYADPALDTKPELLTQRGGAFYAEAAVGLIASLSGAPGLHSANVRNNGTLPFLSAETVIETTCSVDVDGAVPRATAPLTPEQRGLVAHVSAYEELALEAAIHGGRERVYRALLAHPLIGQHKQADRLTDLLIAANVDHLPWAR